MTSAIATQLIFHYLDGRNESFTIYETIPSPAPKAAPESTQTSAPQSTPKSGQRPGQQSAKNNPGSPTPPSFQFQVRHLLGKDWWVLHLPEKSVLINMDTVVKVEINPPLSPETDDILAKVDSVGATLLTAMQDF